MAEKLVVWGAGGQARVCSNIARLSGRFDIVGFLDDVNPQRWGAPFCGATILGGADQLALLRADGVRCVALAFGRTAARLHKADWIAQQGLDAATLIHPTAIVAPDVSISGGTTIGAGVIIDPNVRVGRCVLLGIGATIAHDCVLEDGVRVSSGAHLGGMVTLERGAMIGTGSSVRNGVRIGAGTLVGIGAVVVEDLPAGVVAAGIPARVIRPVHDDDI